jgi:hypothetical protein
LQVRSLQRASGAGQCNWADFTGLAVRFLVDILKGSSEFRDSDGSHLSFLWFFVYTCTCDHSFDKYICPTYQTNMMGFLGGPRKVV